MTNSNFLSSFFAASSLCRASVRLGVEAGAPRFLISATSVPLHLCVPPNSRHLYLNPQNKCLFAANFLKMIEVYHDKKKVESQWASLCLNRPLYLHDFRRTHFAETYSPGDSKFSIELSLIIKKTKIYSSVIICKIYFCNSYLCLLAPTVL